jgi:hypothetical protein
MIETKLTHIGGLAGACAGIADRPQLPKVAELQPRPSRPPQ